MDSSKTIFVLGSGFSRSLFNKMPLLTDLSRSIKNNQEDILKRSMVSLDYAKKIPDVAWSNVELLLTYLSKNLPWKSDADKHLSFAMLEEVNKEIRKQLVINLDSEELAIEKGIIKSFFKWAHVNTIHAVTFNYDTLYETLFSRYEKIHLRQLLYLGKDIYIKTYIYPALETRVSVDDTLNKLGFEIIRGNDNNLIVHLNQDVFIKNGKSIKDQIKNYLRSKVEDFFFPEFINFAGTDESGKKVLDYDNLSDQIVRSVNDLLKNEAKIDLSDFYPIKIPDSRTRMGVSLWGKQSFLSPCLLYKLHGSSNWHYSRSSKSPSEPIYLSEFEEEGLSPFIVPPVLEKGGYYGHDLIRQLWEGAKFELSKSDEVIFIGYSFPESDAPVKLFFDEVIKKDAEIKVVNIDDSSSFKERIASYLPNRKVKHLSSIKAVIPKSFLEE